MEFISAQKIPAALLPPYIEFFKTFRPSEEHTVPALKVLLTLAMMIDADMTWVAHLEKPISVLVEGAWLDTDAQVNVATILCQ